MAAFWIVVFAIGTLVLIFGSRGSLATIAASMFSVTLVPPSLLVILSTKDSVLEHREIVQGIAGGAAVMLAAVGGVWASVDFMWGVIVLAIAAGPAFGAYTMRMYAYFAQRLDKRSAINGQPPDVLADLVEEVRMLRAHLQVDRSPRRSSVAGRRRRR